MERCKFSGYRPDTCPYRCHDGKLECVKSGYKCCSSLRMDYEKRLSEEGDA